MAPAESCCAPFEFLRGEGAQELAIALRRARPDDPCVAYAREESLGDVALGERFPNPFCLVPVSTTHAPRVCVEPLVCTLCVK